MVFLRASEYPSSPLFRSMLDIAPPQVDASMNNVVIELQAKYQAAFGKPEDSDVSNYPHFSLLRVQVIHPRQLTSPDPQYRNTRTTTPSRGYASTTTPTASPQRSRTPSSAPPRIVVARSARQRPWKLLRRAARQRPADRTPARAPVWTRWIRAWLCPTAPGRLWLWRRRLVPRMMPAPARSGTGTRMDCSP